MQTVNHRAILPTTPDCRLIGLWRFSFDSHHTIRTQSTTGHLVHLILHGNYHLRLSGHEFHPQPGQCIWYHDREPVQWLNNGQAVSFLSCQFSSPTINPPVPAQRCWDASTACQQQFQVLWEATQHLPERANHFIAHAEFLHLIAHFLREQRSMPAVNPWMQCELWAQQHDALHWPIKRLAKNIGLSQATLDRHCRQQHQCGPGQRLRQMRLEQALALLTQTTMGIEAIAHNLHFRDGSSLARCCRQHFGQNPTELRRPQ